MFCTNCGTKITPGSTNCSGCGAAVGDESAPQAAYSTQNSGGDASLPKGCLVLIVSFFTMPIKTAGVAASELRSIGRVGSLATDNDFPHMSWFKAVVPIIATITSILIVFYGFMQLFTGYDSMTTRIGTFVGSLFLAILIDWVIMWAGEAINIYIASGQYYSKQLRDN